MAVTGAGMFLALKAGFIWHNDPQPWPISSGPVTVGAIVVAGLGIARLLYLGIRAAGKASVRAQARTAGRHAISEHIAARAKRVAELASNPATAKYAPLVERGEEWWDENIAYFENPDATLTCEHLQPIERAMRATGVSLRRLEDNHALADCRIDESAPLSRFEAGPPVRYSEFYAGERSEHDHPMAFLTCDVHKSHISTKHPEEGGARSAPWFPAS
jgi:hypothetical protein